MSDFDYSSTYACAPRPPGTTDVLQWLQTWLNVHGEEAHQFPAVRPAPPAGPS